MAKRSDERRRNLSAWVSTEEESEGNDVPKLPLWAGLYASPNPDKTRKGCVNCVMWVQPKLECHIHDTDVTVTGEMTCGYHVFGRPALESTPRDHMQPVEPEQSGLELVPSGTSCDSCSHFEPTNGSTSGMCTAFHDPEDPESKALVDSLGCCAAWTNDEQA